jgi:response regulator NasT
MQCWGPSVKPAFVSRLIDLAGASGKIISSISHFVHCTIFQVAQNAAMTEHLPSVLIIDENMTRASIIEAGLSAAGHSKVTVISEMHGIAAKIALHEPDVIVIDLENPNRDMLENIFQLSRAVKRPIAMFVDRSEKEAMQSAIDAGVSAYVVDGLRQERVKSILDMAISRFNAFSRLERELEEARGALEQRKVIDQAKGLIMKSRGVDEDTAYKLLRKAAMNGNRKIVDVAESLVMSARLLGDEGK